MSTDDDWTDEEYMRAVGAMWDEEDDDFDIFEEK